MDDVSRIQEATAVGKGQVQSIQRRILSLTITQQARGTTGIIPIQTEVQLRTSIGGRGAAC
jgi:hypothetical protein